MEQFNYNRKYELIISSPVNLGSPQKEYKDSPVENDSTDYYGGDFTVTYQKAMTITDLHIEADVKGSTKTSGSKSQNTTVKIFNLSAESRAFIEKVNNFVMLKAGYDNSEELPIIFTGQISKCLTKREGSDLVTTLTCSEAEAPKNAVRVSMNVERGFTYTEVFNRIVAIWKKNGIAVGEIILDKSPDQAPAAYLPPASTYLEKSMTFAGFLRQITDDLCKQFNLTYQIINGTIHIHPKYYGDLLKQVTVNYDNIISIEDSQDGQASTSNNPDTKGINVTILLDGRCNTSKRLKIEGGDREGDYRINSHSHKLSYEGTQWYTTLDCSAIGG